MVTKQISKTIFVILFLSFLISKPSYAQKEIIVKQLEFKLELVSDNEYENELFVTLKFTKGIKYLFKVSNHIDDFAGEAVFELLDADQLVLTNYLKSSDKYYTQTAFICNKTGFYDVLVKYKDNKVGYSTVDIYMIQ